MNIAYLCTYDCSFNIFTSWLFQHVPACSTFPHINYSINSIAIDQAIIFWSEGPHMRLIFAWKWNKGQIQIGPISALESPHSLKAHVRLRLWISGTKQCSWDLCLYSVGKMIRRTTRRWTSQIFLRTIHLEITNNNDAIWNQNHGIFLKQVYILQEMSPWHSDITLGHCWLKNQVI